jgi:FlaG/FlaF family flagellin (archaellin)
MQYLKRMMEKNDEDGVSPVVGVMLMLIVTVLIAAVVSGFAGGLVGGHQKSPTLTMDVQIVNTGSYLDSGFSANVLGVSQPINTNQLKIVTSWTTTMKDNTSADLAGTSMAKIADGTFFIGGNTSLPNSQNVGELWTGATVPFGVGKGIIQGTEDWNYPDGYFGNYTLQAGVGLFAYPAYGSPRGSDFNGGYNGVTPYFYASGSDFTAGSTVDPTIAVLGGGWEQLRAGDTVHVKVIYTPTGATIFSKDVPVTEGS